MWSLYLLPGRIIAELGFLWPGRGDLWASKRRRESSFAHFLLATPFWLVFALFVVPIVAALVSSAFHGPHTHTDMTPTSMATSKAEPAASADEDSSSSRSAGRRSSSSDEAPAAPKIKPTPTIRFAEPRAVIQTLPTARASYAICSATVTDHCVER